MSDPKTPVEQAIDLFVYAPIGLALTAAEELPKLIDKGRERVTGRTAMYKMIGQFAMAEGQRRADKLVRDAGSFFAGGSGPEPEPMVTEDLAPEPVVTEPMVTEDVAPEPVVTEPAPSVRTNGNGSGATPLFTQDVPSADDLAIPGYDVLSASQVVQRLAGLSPEELEAVRVYETATRGRKTILNRIAQLQSAG